MEGSNRTRGRRVADIDRVAMFYARYFGAQVGHSLRDAARDSIAFPHVRWRGRLEVMTRKDVTGRAANEQLGLAHGARIGDEATVVAGGSLAGRRYNARQRASPHR